VPVPVPPPPPPPPGHAPEPPPPPASEWAALRPARPKRPITSISIGVALGVAQRSIQAAWQSMFSCSESSIVRMIRPVKTAVSAGNLHEWIDIAQPRRAIILA
jgi:hypothetical protein